MQNYSQNNEQSIILKHFGAFRGTFLDCGANDGITLSNTYALGLIGWSGTLVEASPVAFARLQVNCTDQCLIHAAIATYDGTIKLHESGELLGTGDVSLVSSTVESELRRWDSIEMPFTEVEVPCLTFASILERTPHKTFDFISMDIEGMELEVLPQMDLQKLRCKLLCVEFNGHQLDKFNAIVLPQGYRLIHRNSENLIYAKN